MSRDHERLLKSIDREIKVDEMKETIGVSAAVLFYLAFAVAMILKFLIFGY